MLPGVSGPVLGVSLDSVQEGRGEEWWDLSRKEAQVSRLLKDMEGVSGIESICLV